MGDPRVSDFVALLEVARTNSFSNAARNLQTSPVVLLNKINKMENYFQIKIFTRTNRGVFLTKEGEKVVETAKAVVGLLAGPQITQAASTPGRILRIGTSEIAGEYILPCIISNYKMANPAVGFSLEILSPQVVPEKESSGMLDLVSYLKPPGEKVPNQLEVAKDRLIIITPPKHELVWKENVSMSDMLRFPLILYEPGHEMCGLVDSFLDANGVNKRGMDVKMLLPDPASAIAAVSEGLGVSLCSELIARKSERAGLVNIVVPYNVKGCHYSIYVKRTAAGDEAVNHFWDYLEKMSERFKGNLPCMMKILYL